MNIQLTREDVLVILASLQSGKEVLQMQRLQIDPEKVEGGIEVLGEVLSKIENLQRKFQGMQPITDLDSYYTEES